MFDSVHIDDLLINRVTKLAGLGSPAPRTDVTLLAARHGAIDRTAYYSNRVIDLEGFIVGPDAASAWAQFDVLKGALRLGTTHTLKFRRTGMAMDEQVGVVVSAPVDDTVVPNYPGLVKWGVTLSAADPRIYSAVLSSASYDPTAALSGGGAGIPLAFPLAFSATASELEVVNGGNTPTPPVLTVQGPVVNPILDNNVTDESIPLLYALGVSDSIEVDVAARTVRLNGALRYDLLDAPNTEWWELEPGTNGLRLRGTGMASNQTLLTVAYRDARI